MAMVFPADTSDDTLYARSLPVPQTSPPGPPQMPLSAAHQVSPVMGTTPPPAVQPSPMGPRGWTPLVAYTPGVPGTEPHAESLLLSDDDSADSQQEEDPLPPSQPAFKSYSPADTARQKVPAVAAAAVTYEEQIQAMKSAWNNHAADANEADAPDEQQENADDENGDDEPGEEQSEDDDMEDMSSRETSVRYSELSQCSYPAIGNVSPQCGLHVEAVLQLTMHCLADTGITLWYTFHCLQLFSPVNLLSTFLLVALWRVLSTSCV